MQRVISATMALLVSGLLLVGCTRESERAKTTAPKVTSSDIETRIKARLGEDPELRAADLKVNADADENKVSMSGSVETEALRMRAVSAARGAQPGIIVEDKIDVKPRELSRAEYTDERASEERTRAHDTGDKVGNSLDDAWVHSKIVAKLIGNSATPERKINVD